MSDKVPMLRISDVAVREGALYISYDMTNTAGRNIYVRNIVEDCHRMLGLPPGEVRSSRVAHAFHDGGEQVLLFQGTCPVVTPEPLMLYAPVIPRAVLLPKDKTLRATIRVPLPIVEWHPYDRPLREGPAVQPVVIRSVRLAVEYAHKDDLRSKPYEDRQNKGTYQISAYPLRRVEAISALPVPCRLMRVTEPLFRVT